MQPAAVYELYRKWCTAHGVKADNNINLGKQLKRLGFNKTRSNGKDYWRVDETPAGTEIRSKTFPRVEEIVPDIADAANSAEPLMDRDEKAEEKIAA